MELRYAQLMKQQEKMVQEMEKSVAHRETIVLRTELENKKSSKQVSAVSVRSRSIRPLTTQCTSFKMSTKLTGNSDARTGNRR